MRLSFKKRLIIFTLLLVTTNMLLWHKELRPWLPKVSSRIPCLQKTIYPRIAGHVFAIPQPILWGTDPKMHTKVKNMTLDCAKGSYPPFDVKQVTLWPGRDFPQKFPSSGRSVINMEMFEMSSLSPLQQLSSYQNIRKVFATINVDIKKLPIENGFYVWAGLDKPRHQKNYYDFAWLYHNNWYISVDPGLKTPNGEPVVFGCHAGDCGTSFQYNDFIKISISDVNLQTGTMKEFFVWFLKYIDSLEVKNPKADK